MAEPAEPERLDEVDSRVAVMPRTVDDVDPVADRILGLQRLIGNRNVVRLLALQRQAGDGGVATLAQPRPLVNDPMAGETSGDLAPPAPRPLLRLGAEGSTVEELQLRLNEDGADPTLAVDGRFGRNTDGAVRAFQARHGCKVDGIVGPQTWGLLDELDRADIVGPHDVMADTHSVTTEEAAAVAAQMVTTPPAPGGMTGAGNNGQFEQEVFAALDAYYAHRLSIVGTPTTSMTEADEIARVAQRLIDDFYNDVIVMASRPPALGEFHPGSFRMPIADASTRQVDPLFAREWVKMDVEFAREDPAVPSPLPGEVSQTHEVDTRRPGDRAEVDRVSDKYLRSGRLSTVVRMIQAYPAEASSGTVFVQLGDPSFQGRQGRWDLLSGFMHEYLHLAAHPGYTEAADTMGGGARRVLIEGFCDYFREQAWNALRPRFSTDDDLRRRVEGPAFFTAVAEESAIVPHGTYDEIANARMIVSALDRPEAGAGPIPLGSAGGEANARAAYFMGHVELLGIGAGTTGDNPAGVTGTWTPDEAADDGIYIVARGGETLREVSERSGSTSVFSADGLGFVDPAHRFPAGERLSVAGVRYLRAATDDTRAQVAGQNGISQEALERANRWAPAPGNTRVARGTRLLIPVH
ncbi:MAG: peptidoglycan-binding domain-containing protein [Ilumatobacteraceae bacterium]